MNEVDINISKRLDELEVTMQYYPETNCELEHTFTDGLYSRAIFMPSGTLVTSRVHNTEHQYAILAGVVAVKINNNEWEMLSAPYTGITKPGTRRLLYIVENCMWVTYHPIDVKPENDSKEAIKKAVDQIDELILDKHVNELLGGELKNNILIKELHNEN